ncbi:MAG: hypothetical protein K2P81_04355 [Bacteriovoracaceae bacterium]|nr:hypothetical protein [Bacteriovoracaceae bacterium]
MEVEIPLFLSLDEQVLVNFTGRVNVLDRLTHQMLGVVVLKEGQVYRCQYKGVMGLKAFYNIVVEGAQLQPQEFIVEPEIIEEKDRQIHFPYSVLKNKTAEVLSRYQAVSRMRPPDNVKLMAKAEFLTSRDDVDEAEFQVICALSEWNSVKDLYIHCPLLDYEITESLVSLRKKNALQVIGSK